MNRPERVKTSVLKISGGAAIREMFCRIDHIGEPYGFGLFVSGVCVATCEHPARLSEYAFNNDAEGVTHNYDLRLAE